MYPAVYVKKPDEYTRIGDMRAAPFMCFIDLQETHHSLRRVLLCKVLARLEPRCE